VIQERKRELVSLLWDMIMSPMTSNSVLVSQFKLFGLPLWEGFLNRIVLVVLVLGVQLLYT
jgi:hypothetical protein